jgi:hypothetical protein
VTSSRHALQFLASRCKQIDDGWTRAGCSAQCLEEQIAVADACGGQDEKTCDSVVAPNCPGGNNGAVSASEAETLLATVAAAAALLL